MNPAMACVWIHGSLLLALTVPVVVTAQVSGPLELLGEWPTYGFDANQTRSKLKDTATNIPKNPALRQQTDHVRPLDIQAIKSVPG
jgi:hypothetical protein